MPPEAASTCPSESTISDLLQRKKRLADFPDLSAHVTACPRCRSILARLISTMADANAPTQPAPLGDRSAGEPFVLETVAEGRYVVGREIARGGMGRIVEAWDTRHRRQVAIKLLLQPGPDAKRRFLREVRITAWLQHPAIVSLYEAGQWTSGEPFFAMKLVEGRALSEVIAETTTVVSSGGSLRAKLALLPSLITMTEALAYAHDRGIVHRDLKPSNVLLGAFGETVVIDWGLAKEQGEAAEGAEGDSPSTASSDEQFLTRTGAAMGTVGYMAPEQARAGAVDERADVYALGAVLYHLFAGTPPHLSISVEETLEKLMSGPPDPLGALVPELAPDVITIIEKAMARDPADRYPDARAMAEDLKLFAAGKLVAAHSYSLRTLLRRWVARHAAVVATAAVLLLALVATVTLSMRRVIHERDKAHAAKEETERARGVAVAQRDAAEKLVEFMVKDLKQKLQVVGRLDLIVGVGDEIDRYYEAASAVSPDAPTLVRRAQALQLVAIVEDYKLDEKGAAPLFEHAIELSERALALAPNDSTAQITLVNLHVNVAGPLIDLARLDLAEKHARAGIEVGHQAVNGHPGDPRSASVLARAELRLALVLRHAGRAAETPPLYAEACSLLDGAAAALPADLEIARQLGWAYFERGDAELDRGDPEAAAKSYARSVEAREHLCALDPTPQRTQDVAWSRLKASAARVRSGDFDAAMSDGAAAIARLDETAAADRGNTMTQRDFALALGTLGSDEVDIGRCASAAARTRQAGEILEKIAHDAPNAEAQIALMQIVAVLGSAELCDGHPREARVAFARVVAANAKLPGADLALAADTMDAVGPSLALAELASGDSGAAFVTAREAAARADKRLPGGPKEYGPQQAVGLAQMALGDVLAARHDPAAAASYRAAHDAFVGRTAVIQSPLVDPVLTAEAALKLARFAPKEEATALLGDAVSGLEALEQRHRLVPRGIAALKDARARAGSR